MPEKSPARATSRLFIVSGPSGAGKTSVCGPILERFPAMSMSVSVTTREARVGERDGVDYHFISDQGFDGMLARGEFAEWAEVHGHRYGTSLAAIEAATAAGNDVILDIDVQGARQIKARFPDAVSVFLLPPSRQRLEERLSGRGTDAADTIRRRLDNACAEVAEASSYDHVVINDDLDRAIAELAAIVSGRGQVAGGIEPEALRWLVDTFQAKT